MTLICLHNCDGVKAYLTTISNHHYRLFALWGGSILSFLVQRHTRSISDISCAALGLPVSLCSGPCCRLSGARHSASHIYHFFFPFFVFVFNFLLRPVRLTASLHCHLYPALARCGPCLRDCFLKKKSLASTTDTFGLGSLIYFQEGPWLRTLELYEVSIGPVDTLKDTSADVGRHGGVSPLCHCRLPGRRKASSGGETTQDSPPTLPYDTLGCVLSLPSR